ncbi:TonB-dependent receptor plug domain-containing protein [Caldimonas sp.]|uniref:TonB-dependent receptor plug domain-containing protein n=1 Tax=Caldimonas sp. TaxID=2838790 RepID=UPI00391B7AB9
MHHGSPGPMPALALCLGLALVPAGPKAQPLAAALDTIVVTGTRTERSVEDTPVRTEVVGPEELRRTHARTLKEALENLPGVQLREIHGKSGYELSMQGLGSDQVLVLIDGLPLTASTGSTVDLSQYLLTDVQRIEVVKGAASAQYGSSAMGGVVNVITRGIAPGRGGFVLLEGGSRGAQNPSGRRFDLAQSHVQLGVQGGSQRWRLRIVGDVLDDQGFALDPAAWARQGDAVQRAQAGVRLAWHPVRQGEVWLDASQYREDAEKRYDYYVPPRLVPQRKTEDAHRDRLAAGTRWRWDAGWSLDLRGVHERYQADTFSYSNAEQTGRRRAELDLSHLSAQLDAPPLGRQLWQFGIDVHREGLSQTNNGQSEVVLDGRVARRSHELFVQNDIALDERWELLLGVRWQDDSDFGGHTAPKLSVRRRIGGQADWRGSLRASLGQGYRVPNLKERYYLFDHSALGYRVIGNPDLRPESSTSAQLGASVQIGTGLSLEANLFHNRVRDLIQTDLARAVVIDGVAHYTYRNVARARTQGLETGVQWQAWPSLRLQGAYTYTDTRDLDSGSELTRRPRHIARLGADWAVSERNEWSVRVRHQSDELADSASGARSPAWTTVDLRLNHVWRAGWTLFAGVDNVFDTQRDFMQAQDFSPASGRFIYLGLRLSLGPQS